MQLRTNLLNPFNSNRDNGALEEFLILCVFVAGKNSKIQSQKVEQLMQKLNWPAFPLKTLKNYNLSEIEFLLKTIKSGQYKRLSKCLYDLSRKNLDLNNCTAEDLESIHGIGLKTSRFFITYSRDTKEYAVLDVHILNWLRNFYPSAPKATPHSKILYSVYEQLFLMKCTELNLTPQELDLKVWKERQKSWNL